MCDTFNQLITEIGEILLSIWCKIIAWNYVYTIKYWKNMEVDFFDVT